MNAPLHPVAAPIKASPRPSATSSVRPVEAGPDASHYERVGSDFSYSMTADQFGETYGRYTVNECGEFPVATAWGDGFKGVRQVLDTPLCVGCDQPIRNARCDDCQLVFVEMLGSGRIAA